MEKNVANEREVLIMRVEIDLTEEEIKMIRMALEDRGTMIFNRTQDEKVEDKYYNLADRFRHGTTETIMKL